MSVLSQGDKWLLAASSPTQATVPGRRLSLRATLRQAVSTVGDWEAAARQLRALVGSFDNLARRMRALDGRPSAVPLSLFPSVLPRLVHKHVRQMNLVLKAADAFWADLEAAERRLGDAAERAREEVRAVAGGSPESVCWPSAEEPAATTQAAGLRRVWVAHAECLEAWRELCRAEMRLGSGSPPAAAAAGPTVLDRWDEAEARAGTARSAAALNSLIHGAGDVG